MMIDKGLVGFTMALILADPALSQSASRGKSQQGIYDSGTKRRLIGILESICEQPAKQRNQDASYHLYLRDKNGQRNLIHLGPKAFFDDHDLKLNLGMELRIIAQEMDLDREKVFVAREIESGDQQVMIPDSFDRPTYSKNLSLRSEGLKKAQ